MGYIKRHKRGFNSIVHILHIEPTEEQKILAEKERIERRERVRQFNYKLGMMMHTIQKYCPDTFDRLQIK